MKQYRPVGRTAELKRDIENHHRFWQAKEIKDTYGLWHDIEEIIQVWEDYSDRYAAGWLIHDKEGVESAFHIRLEEV